MYSPVTIDVQRAYQKTRAGQATLVCAYQNDEKCRSILLDGALTYSEFLERRKTIPWNREIIFYCTGSHEESSTQRAEQFSGEFLSTRALAGGVDAWREAGFPMRATQVRRLASNP